jgi:hypothetical protein
VDVLTFTWIGMIVFINAVIAINLLTQNQPTMSKDKKEKQKSGNLKTTRKINNDWTIDFSNTSDIGYPDGEYYVSIEKED